MERPLKNLRFLSKFKRENKNAAPNPIIPEKVPH
ncbi:hypothetical protein J2736_006835, partial [Paenibacillus qinlingensis]|nr:hypothetical protein [Paenibacillus qinlingensis]